jgi:hypothetical protein
LNDHEKLIAALKEMLKYGEHDGPCDNENDFEYGPCNLHIAAANRREVSARELLKEMGEL